MKNPNYHTGQPTTTTAQDTQIVIDNSDVKMLILCVVLFFILKSFFKKRVTQAYSGQNYPLPLGMKRYPYEVQQQKRLCNQQQLYIE